MQKKLKKAKDWWKSIQKKKEAEEIIDTLSFADSAMEYLPIIMAELERLEKKSDKGTPN